MKKTVFYVVLITVLLISSSCTKITEAIDYSTSIPDITDYRELGYEQVLQFYKSPDGKIVTELISFFNPYYSKLIINEQETDIYWELNESSSYWHSYDQLDNIECNPGQKLSFYFEVNNNTYEGEIEILPDIDILWEEFDFEKDYDYNWTITDKPDYYNIGFRMLCEENNIDNRIYRYWKVGKNKTEASLSKENFIEFKNSRYYHLTTLVTAINEVVFEKCYVMYISNEWNEQWYIEE